MLLRHAGRMRWRQRYVYQPRPRRFHGRNRADPVVRIRESPQGRGAQCRADRGAARPTAFEEGIRQLKAPPSPEGLLFHHHMHFVILLVRWFAQQKDQGNYLDRYPHHEVEIIKIGDHSCLPIDLSIQRSEEQTSELQSLMRTSYAVL